ncbi:CDP-alcohol phosphatidyltransferase family protein [Psychroflexus sp. CAK57W]|uniref:CDP-alcohol phosphatidyltransferase family protein n=1 Tax=Psychroflexus curvus TaxID=2873595 RepID=UPI001CCBA535|nr:CDP-alcohol phosphatidyltransferase family protein [Psychroflexus curvus]MBZ9627837.1 CDP-alcohol phosphatidyltransferase family protein [Psychroflexus curvus]MBZ9787514.1 CDP-alcohol phosphatidyltransferase family protein [Psychroflexus curvus]
MIKRQIPNFITLLNLLAGSIASVFAVQGDLSTATLFVAIGIFFDFFDGLAARALDVKSEMGLQLDSLADMVTSGLVPGIVMCQLLSRSLNSSSALVFLSPDTNWMVFIGLIITLGSAYRLAKFNIDERQTDSFIGLPTPANALLILSLGLILEYHPESFTTPWIENTYVLIFVSILSVLLLNAEIKLFALKFKNLNVKENWFRYFIVVFSIITIIWLQFVAIPIIIFVYLLLSIVTSGLQSQQNK